MLIGMNKIKRRMPISTSVIAEVEVKFTYSLTEYANTIAYADTCTMSVDEITTVATATFTTISAYTESLQLSNINNYLNNDCLRDILTDNPFRDSNSSNFPVAG